MSNQFINKVTGVYTLQKSFVCVCVCFFIDIYFESVSFLTYIQRTVFAQNTIILLLLPYMSLNFEHIQG